MKDIFSKQQIKSKILQVKNSCLSSKNSTIIYDGNSHFEGTFRKAIWPFLVIGQLYGVMPVIGISSRSLSDLHFNWKSFRAIYAVIVAIILSSYSLFVLWKIFTDSAYSNIINCLFYVLNTLEFIGFLVLSLHWPELMRYWQNIESLPIFQNGTYKTGYVRRIRIVAFTTLLLAFVEHWLFISTTIQTNLRKNGDKEILGDLVKVSVPHLIPPGISLPDYVELLICYINENSTFVWNFIDIFIMIVGIGLSTHFKVFNDELKRAIDRIEDLPTNYWMKIQNMRIQYTKLCDLVAVVDEKISFLILISFSNNLFMICVQIFKSSKALPTHLNMIYFWCSLTYLIMRTVAVSMFAARIYEESQKPIKFLRLIPTHLWNEETKRFFGDILCKRVALTGIFFCVTRKLILSVVGTIITYELVLLQFNRY